jgi:hypothetical protein
VQIGLPLKRKITNVDRESHSLAGARKKDAVYITRYNCLLTCGDGNSSGDFLVGT